MLNSLPYTDTDLSSAQLYKFAFFNEIENIIHENIKNQRP